MKEEDKFIWRRPKVEKRKVVDYFILKDVREFIEEERKTRRKIYEIALKKLLSESNQENEEKNQENEENEEIEGNAENERKTNKAKNGKIINIKDIMGT